MVSTVTVESEIGKEVRKSNKSHKLIVTKCDNHCTYIAHASILHGSTIHRNGQKFMRAENLVPLDG